jgi:hypothetical protein
MVGQRDIRLKPELGFAMRMREMDVHSRLLAGKEEQAEGAITDDSRGHSGLGANVKGEGRGPGRRRLPAERPSQPSGWAM